VRLFQLMDRKPEIPPRGGRAVLNFVPRIELDNVSFRYPARAESLVLHNATLTVEPGTVVALVGPSGGGKSTTVALIERFYDPESGAVRIGGLNARDIDPQWLHRHVALVGQEPVLFALSIADNIRFGKVGGKLTCRMCEKGRRGHTQPYHLSYSSFPPARGVAGGH